METRILNFITIKYSLQWSGKTALSWK